MDSINKITIRLLIGFLLLSPLPIAGLAWFYMQQFDHTLRQNELEKFSTIADKKSNQINAYLNERLTDNRVWAASPIIIDALQKLAGVPLGSARHLAIEKPYQSYIETLRLKESGYQGMMLTSLDGRTVLTAQNESNPDVSNAGTLLIARQAALHTGETQITPAYPSSDKQYAVFIVTPILQSGRMIGTLDMQLDTEQLTAVARDATGLGKTGTTVLSQPQGDQILFIGPQQRFPDAEFFHYVLPNQIGAPMQAALSGVSGKGISRDYSGVEVIGAWRYLPALNWGMVVKMNTSEAFEPLYRLQKTIAIALTFSLLMSCLIAVLFGRSLVAPIRKLITATGQIAEGDLSRRAPVLGWAELQQLAISFNHMTERLQAYYSELETQVRQRTAELSKALNLAKEAQRIAHLGNWEMDLVNNKLIWSDEIYHLFEIDQSIFAANQETFLNTIHPDDREAAEQAYAHSLKTRAPYDIEHRLLMPDGRIKWVRQRCSSDFDDTGKATRSVGTVQDITERRRVEIALMQSESLFRTLAQVAPVGIFHTDASGMCTYVNEQYCKIAGIIQAAAVGHGWLSSIHPEDIAIVTDNWKKSIQTGTAFHLEYRYRRPSGHITWVVGQAKAELDEQGKLLGYVGTITDINERKQNEVALQHFNDELEQRVEQRTALLLAAKMDAEAASRSKSLFLTSVSHELRTPLNAMLGYAQLMQLDASLPVQILDNAGEIIRAGDHLLSLLNDVLDMASIESGNIKTQLKTFKLKEITGLCHAQHSQLASRRKITLICDDSCNLPNVRGDSQHLLQVLNNLLSNAIKYNRDGGQVILSAATLNGYTKISVTDTGSGISPEMQKRLFQPFDRLGAEMGTIEGAGIGLSIARSLMELMNGRIGADSTYGKGSTFWVELPCAEGPAIKTAGERPVTTPRILVAEDYAPNQTVLRMQIQALGYEVEIAANGAEALAKFRTEHYDLILTDLNMPVMDGPALALAIRHDESLRGVHTPIIAITAADSSELERCRGMDDILAKPIALEGLCAVLARWLNTATPEALDHIDQSEILNLGHLYHHLGKIDFAQACSLIATFIRAASAGLDQPHDAQSFTREMHKQKSSARTVGALHYAKLAEAMEKKFKSGDDSDIASSLAELRRAMIQVENASAALHQGIETNLPATIGVTTLQRVLVIDDDPVVVQQMKSLLITLGVSQVLSARNGLEAIEILASHNIELLLCDLNMPEMDGVELIRNIGKSGFEGGLILMSGADEKILATVNKLAVLQGLYVLGHLGKPVLVSQLMPMLLLYNETPVDVLPVSFAPVITEADIRNGMSGGEFTVWFQPKVDATTLHPVGVEALARWRRKDGQLVPPELFIILAEQTELIGELSQTLLAAAFSEGAKLFSAGFPLKIAVNLSGRWLNDLSLPDLIFSRAMAAKLNAEDIILEVTETGVFEDLTTALDVLTRLRIKGFGLSIDDFGIGYSSFEQLGRIPFTEMKLDRSFVSRGTQDSAARAILESSMDMARKLKLATVAEGVETQQDLELVRSLRCDLVQGYFIANPMPVGELINWLSKRYIR